MCCQTKYLPGHADVAYAVSLIAVTGEALLYGSVRPLTAALSADRKGAPVHGRQPSAGWVLSSAGFYQLNDDNLLRIKTTITLQNAFLTNKLIQLITQCLSS